MGSSYGFAGKVQRLASWSETIGWTRILWRHRHNHEPHARPPTPGARLRDRVPDPRTPFPDRRPNLGRRRRRPPITIAWRALKGSRGAYRRTVRSRRVPIAEPVRAAIREHLAVIGSGDPSRFIFASARSREGDMDRPQAFHVLVGACGACAIDSSRVSTHSLQKTLANRIFAASGRDLIRTQRIIGHSSPVTTARYLETDQSDLDRLVLTSAARGYPFRAMPASPAMHRYAYSRAYSGPIPGQCPPDGADVHNLAFIRFDQRPSAIRDLTRSDVEAFVRAISPSIRFSPSSNWDLPTSADALVAGSSC